MAQLLNKKEDFKPHEYIVQRALVYFGMSKKIKEESIEKILSDENL